MHTTFEQAQPPCRFTFTDYTIHAGLWAFQWAFWHCFEQYEIFLHRLQTMSVGCPGPPQSPQAVTVPGSPLASSGIFLPLSMPPIGIPEWPKGNNRGIATLVA